MSEKKVVLAFSLKDVQRRMNWNERSKRTVILKRSCGVLALFGGLRLISTAR